MLSHRVSPSARPMTGCSGGVRYAAAFRINQGYLRLLDHPLEAGDDSAAYREECSLMIDAPAMPADPAAQ
jgi:hypothetical protein